MKSVILVVLCLDLTKSLLKTLPGGLRVKYSFISETIFHIIQLLFMCPLILNL